MAAENEQISNSGTPGPAPVGTSTNLSERIGKLDAGLERANRDIEDLKKSDRSWFKKAGILIGVLGGAIAIPKIVTDTVNAIYHPPKVTIEWSRPLDLRYDQHDRVFRLEFPVVANNEGKSTDFIETLSANLNSDTGQINIPVSDGDIEVRENEKSIPQPIPIEPGKTKLLMIGLSLGPPLSEQALSFEGRRTINVTLKMRSKKEITNHYCFDFDKEQGQEVMAAQEKHVRTPSCGETL
jgi:hypothetical protein